MRVRFLIVRILAVRTCVVRIVALVVVVAVVQVGLGVRGSVIFDENILDALQECLQFRKPELVQVEWEAYLLLYHLRKSSQ